MQHKSVRLISPLTINGRIRKGTGFDDEWINFSPEWAATYESQVNDAIARYNAKSLDDLERGLGEFVLNYETEPLWSLHPRVEVIGGELWGVAVLQVTRDLTIDEMSMVLDGLSFDYSDGWGEGFEQQDIDTPEAVINVSFWRDEDDYFIQPDTKSDPSMARYGGIRRRNQYPKIVFDEQSHVSSETIHPENT